MSRTPTFPLVVVMLCVVAACSVDLGIPEQARLECTVDSECPGRFLCDVSTGACFDPDAAVAPSVSVSVPALLVRPVTELSFDIQVTDSNRSETQNVECEYQLGDGVWGAVVLSQPSDNLAPNVPHTLQWPLVGASSSLPNATVETAAGMQDVADFQSEVILRCRATDASGLQGDWSESRNFELGNRAPLLEILSTPERATREVVVPILLTDPAADLAGVEMCFVLPAEPTVCRVAQGSAADVLILAGEAGTLTQAVWSSQAAPDPDPMVPQGIGFANQGPVILRLRAFDTATGEVQAGPWQELNWDTVVNDTAPQVIQLRAPRTEIVSGTAPVHLTYQLVDEEGDPADIVCEFSPSPGVWELCRPFPTRRHEGDVGLHAAPLVTGGVPHTFVWDPGVAVVPRNFSQVRLSAVSSTSGESTTTALSLANAPTPVAPLLAWVSGIEMGDTIRDAKPMEADGDEAVELALRTGSDLWIVNGKPSQGTTCTVPDWATCGLSATQISGAYLSLHVEDFTADPGDEILVTTDDAGMVRVEVLANVGGGGYVSETSWLTGLAVGSLTGTALGHFDSDANLDVLVWSADFTTPMGFEAHTAIESAGWTHSLLGQAQGLATADGVPVPPAAGDVDGDGIADIVQCRGEAATFETTTCAVWRGSGGGALSAPVTWDAALADAPFPAFPYPQVIGGLEILDVDGDGAIELVGLGEALDLFMVAESQAGQVPFGPWNALLATERPKGWTLADVNLDTVPDAVLIGTNPVVLEFRSGPSFAASDQLPLSELSVPVQPLPSASAIHFVDADADGQREFWVKDGNTSLIMVDLQTNTVVDWPVFVGVALHGSAGQVNADVNGDGWPDLVFNAAGGSAEWHPGPLDRQPVETFDVPWLSVAPSFMFAEDLDGDSVDEWIALVDDDISWESAAHGLGLTGSRSYPGNTFATTADIDGDGVREIVTLNYFGTTPDSFGETPGVDCNDGITNDSDAFVDCQDPECRDDPACSTAELCSDGMDNNTDGLVDCEDPLCADFPYCTALGRPQSDVIDVSLPWPLNSVDCMVSSFCQSRLRELYPISSGKGREGILALEVLNDTQQLSRLWYYEFDPTNETWSAPTMVGAVPAASISPPTIADLNSDGLVDIAMWSCAQIFTGCVAERLFTVLWAQPNGTYVPQDVTGTLDFVTGVFPSNPTHQDLDGDGDLDLLFSFRSAKKHLFVYNDGLGNFTIGEDIPAGEDVNRTFAVDANDDGVLDLLSSNSGLTLGRRVGPAGTESLSSWPGGDPPWGLGQAAGQTVALRVASPTSLLGNPEGVVSFVSSGITPGQFAAITRPVELLGAQVLVNQITSVGRRLRVVERLGALDVRSGALNTQDGVILEVPIAFASRLDGGDPTLGLRGFWKTCSFRRVEPGSGDALDGDPEASEFVPQSVDGTDLVICNEAWEETTRVSETLEGTGLRFGLWPDAVSPTHVRVVTDREGFFQLFREM